MKKETLQLLSQKYKRSFFELYANTLNKLELKKILINVQTTKTESERNRKSEQLPVRKLNQ